MAELNLILVIILYTLGIILLTLLIVLAIKTILAVNKMEKAIDNVNAKLNSFNGIFSAIDFATDRIALVSETVISKIAGVIAGMFNKKNKEEENE